MHAAALCILAAMPKQAWMGRQSSQGNCGIGYAGCARNRMGERSKIEGGPRNEGAGPSG